jgi:N-acetylglucosamine malate deacetylase 1
MTERWYDRRELSLLLSPFSLLPSPSSAIAGRDLLPASGYGNLRFMSVPPAVRPILAFGAHPDDIEFGCGAVLAREAALGRAAHLVITSRGEAASHGTPQQRSAEAKSAAAQLQASLEFVDLGGDCHLQPNPASSTVLAAMIRRHRPGIVLAPSLEANQHPDHSALGQLVRDAARLARYGGLAALRDQPPHAIELLFHYAITADAEPAAQQPILIDVSDPTVVQVWRTAMAAHDSQSRSRNYVELQLTRARLYGLRAGVEYAWPLWPGDPLLFRALPEAGSARRF